MSIPAVTPTKYYTVVVTAEPDGSGFNARSPDLPGCFADGDTRAEAMANMERAAESWLLAWEYQQQRKVDGAQ
jgi:predicted RNase H-like HicB family nuclease